MTEAGGSKVLRGRISGWLLILMLLLLWEISGILSQAQSWPPFHSVIAATAKGLASGELLGVLLGTLGRMAAGFCIGGVLGVVAGLILGMDRRLAAAFTPLLEGLRPLPIPAIVPPLILFLGIDDALKIAVVAIAVFFPVLVNTLGGVQSIDWVLLQTARTFGKSRTVTMSRVVAPAVLPSILAGLRIALSLAFVTTIVAEMIAGSGGIGYFIIETQYAMRPDQMYAAVICLAAAGYALNWLFIRLEGRAIRWHRLSDTVPS